MSVAAAPPEVVRVTGLRRALGLRDVVLFYIAAVVGPRWIAVAAAAGPSSLVVWALAAIGFFIPLAFSVIELSSRHPDEGGLYVWNRAAFGDFAGFLSGWMYWASNLVYFPGLLYFAAANALFIGGDRWQHLSTNPAYFIVASLIGIAIAVALNVVGTHVGKWLQNVGAYGTWIPVALLVVMGAVAWGRFGAGTPITPETLKPSFAVKDLIFWSTLAFGFGGFELASLMGDEIHDARRTVPRAIVIGGVAIAAIYMLGTLAILLALPPGEANGLQGIMQAIARTADRVGLGVLVPLAAIGLTLGSVGGVGAWLSSTARLPFVTGLDGYLPAAFGRLHPRWRTPHIAIATQAIIAALFAFLGQAGASVKGAYDVLVSLGVIAYFIPYLYMFAALIRLQRDPAAPGTMRVPGGRLGAWLFGGLGFVTTAGSIVLSLIPSADDPNPRLTTLKVVGGSVLLLVIGTALYLRGHKNHRTA